MCGMVERLVIAKPRHSYFTQHSLWVAAPAQGVRLTPLAYANRGHSLHERTEQYFTHTSISNEKPPENPAEKFVIFCIFYERRPKSRCTQSAMRMCRVSTALFVLLIA